MTSLKRFNVIKTALNVVIILSFTFFIFFVPIYFYYEMQHYREYFISVLIVMLVAILFRAILARYKNKILCDFVMRRLSQVFKQHGSKNFYLECSVIEKRRIINILVNVSGDITNAACENCNDQVEEYINHMIKYVGKPVTCVLNFGTTNIQYVDCY